MKTYTRDNNYGVLIEYTHEQLYLDIFTRYTTLKKNSYSSLELKLLLDMYLTRSNQPFDVEKMTFVPLVSFHENEDFKITSHDRFQFYEYWKETNELRTSEQWIEILNIKKNIKKLCYQDKLLDYLEFWVSYYESNFEENSIWKKILKI